MKENGELFGVLGSSGGYADTIFRYVAKKLFGRDIQGPLDLKIVRNSDFQEVTLEVSWDLSFLGIFIVNQVASI